MKLIQIRDENYERFGLANIPEGMKVDDAKIVILDAFRTIRSSDELDEDNLWEILEEHGINREFILEEVQLCE